MTKTNNLQVIEEMSLGTYVWRTDDGSYVGDDEGHYMCIASRKGDQKNIAALERSARYYGIEGGSAEFRSGSRPVDDEEYELQVARQKAGLVPDRFDVAEAVESYRNMKLRAKE